VIRPTNLPTLVVFEGARSYELPLLDYDAVIEIPGKARINLPRGTPAVTSAHITPM